MMPMALWHNMGDMLVINGGTGTLSYASNAAMANLVYPSVSGSPKVDLALPWKRRAFGEGYAPSLSSREGRSLARPGPRAGALFYNAQVTHVLC